MKKKLKKLMPSPKTTTITTPLETVHQTLSLSSLKFLCLPFICILAICGAGCSHFIGQSAPSPIESETRRLIDHLCNGRATPTAIKGLGTLKINNRDTAISFRIAWMGLKPNHLRIETVGLPGQPSAKLACNGKRLFFQYYMNGQRDFFTYSSEDPSLERLFSIPVRISELLALLTGEVSIHTDYEASLVLIPEKKKKILTLSRWLTGIDKKIYIDSTTDRPCRIENYSFWGDLEYAVDLEWHAPKNGFEIPSKIVLSDAKGAQVDLIVQQFWTDFEIDTTLFELSSAAASQ